MRVCDKFQMHVGVTNHGYKQTAKTINVNAERNKIISSVNVAMEVQIVQCIRAQWFTAGTLVPAVLMATSHFYGNGPILTTHRIRTP